MCFLCVKSQVSFFMTSLSNVWIFENIFGRISFLNVWNQWKRKLWSSEKIDLFFFRKKKENVIFFFLD